MDDNLAFDSMKIEEFCNLIIESNLKIDFAAPVGIRLDTISIKTLKIMERAGFYSISIGIESGANEILEKMNKGITIGELTEKIKLLKNSTDMKITAFFMFGFPDEKLKDRIKTIKYASSIPNDRVYYSAFTPTPGSNAYDSLFKSSLPSRELLTLDFYTCNYVKNTPDIHQIRILRIIGYIVFYFRIRVLKNIISDIKTIYQIKVILVRLRKILFR